MNSPIFALIPLADHLQIVMRLTPTLTHMIHFPRPCKSALARSFSSIVPPPRSALLVRASLLQLSFQLHREVVARIVIIPALLPQVRGTGL